MNAKHECRPMWGVEIIESDPGYWDIRFYDPQPSDQFSQNIGKEERIGSVTRRSYPPGTDWKITGMFNLEKFRALCGIKHCPYCGAELQSLKK